MSYFEDVIEPNVDKTRNRLSERQMKEIAHDTMKSRQKYAKEFEWRGKERNYSMNEMEDSHIINSLNMLIRRIGTEYERMFDDDALYALITELNKRNAKLKYA